MIEIPGYRVIRALGRGGMASVHLAIQESVQREVALKIMAPTLLGDPQFGERFLREARIAAKLRHPNVVQVHDVGVAGNLHYMAMEYLPGGAVIPRDAPPRGLRYALQVTREIAGALGYAHSRGVVHRDIKPDNILLREDGAAVLTDFGIARASDNVRMTMTGSIMGTPSYMSPEQARGVDLDGRSDLYSLGIVFFELLVGRVPFSADDSLSVGIMHITAPIPRLPGELEWLQPVLERLLAKEPALRFQSGNDLAQALADIEQRFTPPPQRLRPDFNPPSPAPASATATPATRALPIPSQAAATADSDPRFGRVDASLLSDRDPRRRAATTAAGSRRWWLLLPLLLAVLLGGGWLFQDRLRALLPQNEMESAMQRAELALAEDRLSTVGDQQGARELFEAILAVNRDNDDARLGLIRVGERWLALAREAVQRGDVEAAERALKQASQLSVPSTAVQEVEEALRGVRGQQTDLAALLAEADAARAANRLEGGADSALALYERVLAVDRGNAVAINGIATVVALLLGQANQAIDSADFAAAEARLARVAAIAPANPDLPAARARLAEAQQAKAKDFSATLQRADQLLQRGRLTAPADGNALALYREVLREAPDNAAAAAGVAKVGAALLDQANRALADFEIDRAAALLDQAAAAEVSAAQLRAARAKLDAARDRQQKLDSALSAASDPVRMRGLLDEAGQAVAAGNLFAPPGDSAFDKFRQVLSADPNNAEARRGVADLPAQVRLRFQQAMQGSRLADARGYVEGLESFKADDPALPEMKRTLSRAYAGFAEERLRAGELGRAQQAFDHARVLDSGNPDLIGLRARIEQASGG